MKKIVFSVCLAVLFPLSLQAADNTSYKTEVLVKSTSSWNGSALPAYPKGKPEVTVLKITIPPGAELPMHEHPVINTGVLISGELTVKTRDGQTLRMKAGDSLVEVVDTWHYGKNEGSAPAEIIVFYAGIQGKPVTIKE